MPKRRIRVMQEHEEQPGHPRQQVEQPTAVQTELLVGAPPVFADPRLAHPANAAWRVQGVQALQRQAGNAALQVLRGPAGVLPPRPAIQHSLPLGAVARQLIPAAEARARGRAADWPELGTQQQAILSVLEEAARSGSEEEQLQLREQALRDIWQAISGGLALRDRVTLEFTGALGMVHGNRVAPSGGATGVTLAYVEATPQCPELRGDPAAHRQHHIAANSEVRAIIQISPSIFHTAPEESVANTHSILLHEYTHVEQTVGRGIHAGVEFLAVEGDTREFLNEAGLPQIERQALESLDEIEAICDEIQNAERTGLARSYEMRRTIDYLWDSYVHYYRSATDPAVDLDRAVVRRVWRYLNSGTRMLLDYLDSEAAQWLTPRLRREARRLPPGYSDDMIRPYR